MAPPTIEYRIGLNLSGQIEICDYRLSVGNQNITVSFYHGGKANNKYCDLIITDKDPSDLVSIPVQQKHCHGTILVINKISNPFLERQYEYIFCKAISLKYKSIKNISDESIKKLINAEFIKDQVKNGKFNSLLLLFNKYTRGELLNRILAISWLLVPFILIVLYLIVKRICNYYFGYSVSFLCWFVVYQPDCETDIFGELKLLVLIYSVFNFMFYYDYMLSVFDNYNNDVLQLNPKRRAIHRSLQFCIPITLIASAFIIFKAIFIFKYDFLIAKEYGFVNISLIFNRCIPYFQDNYLIYYFFILDVSLYLITRNFKKTISDISTPFSSHRQSGILKDAEKGFGCSIMWDIFVIIIVQLLLYPLLNDLQSKLAVQLVILQIGYLYLNLSTIWHDFKYK